MPELCRVVSKAKYTARERRYRNKPQPWIILKFMVAVVVALLIYDAYVYIARFCVPAIQKHGVTERGTAIALLVVFSVLWLWTIWAYVKVTLTSPGFARDYIQKTPKPLLPPSGPHPNSIPVPLADDNADDSTHASNAPEFYHNTEPATIAGPRYEEMAKQYPSEQPDAASSPAATQILEKQEEHGERAPGQPSRMSQDRRRSSLKKPRPGIPEAPQLPPHSQIKESDVPIAYARGPPTTPVLLAQHRYCQRDGFVKPYRAHHCRACGTCILKFDHHCPWIGQCVGARNHKFFLNFNLASSIFTAYTFATLLAFNIHAINALDSNFDPQTIVLIALAALFTLFTATLLVSHMLLIWRGQTTVENLEIRDLKERVKYGSYRDGTDGCLARPDTKALKAFTEEWGSPDHEGYIWWMGSGRKSWEDVMGDNWLGWIFPIGRPLGDGLSYPVNPRFDAEGRWRKRSEWPQELRRPS